MFFRPRSSPLFLPGKKLSDFPAQVILACFALAVIFAGRIQDKIGPRPVATAGGLLLGLGLILAIFSSLLWIVWGKISDLAGRKAALLTMFFLCGLTILFFNNFQNFSLFLIGISLIGLCFDGFLAVFPAITADFWGQNTMEPIMADVYSLRSRWPSGTIFSCWIDENFGHSQPERIL